MSCGVDHIRSLDLELLCLWCRPVPAAPIRPLAWEPPYAAQAALKSLKKKKKKKKKKKEKGKFPPSNHMVNIVSSFRPSLATVCLFTGTIYPTYPN